MSVTEVFGMLAAAMNSGSRVQFSVGRQTDGSPRCSVGTLQSHLLKGAGTTDHLVPGQCV